MRPSTWQRLDPQSTSSIPPGTGGKGADIGGGVVGSEDGPPNAYAVKGDVDCLEDTGGKFG